MSDKGNMHDWNSTTPTKVKWADRKSGWNSQGSHATGSACCHTRRKRFVHLHNHTLGKWSSLNPGT
eukprot:7485578-Prorocentrum_lima.AAC.1